MGDYDRVRPLMSGAVQIDGVDPVCMTLSPEETFFRTFRHQEFDIAEISFSSYLVKLARGESDYVGVPVFLSRTFRHTSIYVRKDRIKKPEDLKGCRIGIPEYQLTALVWARALLWDQYGVCPEDVTWVLGGIEKADREEKITLDLGPKIRLEQAPKGETISSLLDKGLIDGYIAPRAPVGAALSNPNVGWLFDDPIAAAKAYYAETKIFPIMHLVGIRRSLVEQHAWLPAAVFKAFNASKDVALAALTDISAPKITLPFVEEQILAARKLMGEDFWSYGVEPNRHVLETLTRHHHRQGLSPRQIEVSELFHPSTYDSFKI
nr:ABC transporter substrate-binding protein [Eoetvoesiella caeni]